MLQAVVQEGAEEVALAASQEVEGLVAAAMSVRQAAMESQSVLAASVSLHGQSRHR